MKPRCEECALTGLIQNGKASGMPASGSCANGSTAQLDDLVVGQQRDEVVRLRIAQPPQKLPIEIIQSQNEDVLSHAAPLPDLEVRLDSLHGPIHECKPFVGRPWRGGKGDTRPCRPG